MDPLTASLLDLLFELREDGLPITIGGELGLYLKRRHLAETGERTLLERLPEPRSTNDLDLFIRAEILADLGRTSRIAAAIRRLGYEAVEEAKFMQWRRAVSSGGVPLEVKIDLLVGPLGPYRKRLQVGAPRARPRGKIELHAHCVEEALTIDAEPLAVRLAGPRSDGQRHEATVFVPRAFPYLMMKLFAFKDRKRDERKDVGRHHALDLYTVVGMMTEGEYDQAQRLGQALADEPAVRTARHVVAEDFAGPRSLGLLRLREHALFRPDFQVEVFIDVLSEVFRH